MALLIITLPLESADKAALMDCVQSTDGQSLASYVSAPLALLPRAEASLEVVAVVPLQALSWHRVTLPQGSLPRSLLADRGANRLRAILDGLLEDQLLDDPAAMHLALQPQPQVGVPVWVAACDRAWLSSALGALSQAGYNVTRIVPESSPQALVDVIEVTEGQSQPMVAGWIGAASPSDALDGQRSGMLASALSATSVALLAPDTPVVAEPAVAALAEQLFQRPVTLQQRGQRLLQAAQTPWDLAQFEFTNAQRDPRWANLAQGLQSFARAPAWRAARWALALLVVVNLIGLNTWAMRERASLTAQRQAISAVLTDTFPNTQVVVDAPLQMARAVALLQRASGSAAGTDLETILSSFSALAPVEYVPTAIEYAANSLRLSGPAMLAPAQERVISGLKAQGLAASLQGDVWLIRAGGTP
ncbi:type II secretion system protein GspL [Rhodoferax sp.]|uniref:type II secretion system protein GspL n=1 Tax=Rhodoferax sp. TaxID=50421 RepID=UPI002851CA0F|nr:type II secretion system protein GspL [Rhodoferax sp.]MDR3367582.1 type II secretion system protein GspL [Rhodoferax sp.]